MKARLLIALMMVPACAPVAETGESQRPRQVEVGPTEMEIARATEDFHELRDAFLPDYYEARPVRATELGVHDYDDRLPAMDRGAVQQRIDQLLNSLRRLEDIPFTHLEGGDRYEYGILEYALRSELLELEETRTWVKDPRLYTATIASGIAALAERDYAPVPERAGALLGRMDAAHAVMAAARENLSAPPELWTELAIRDTRGLIEFLEMDLGAMLAAQEGAAPPGVEEARDRLLIALREHVAWLEADLLPRSNGDFRLGRYLFERKLQYEEHVSISATQLDQLNERAIEAYRARLDSVAGEMDPARTPRAIMDSLIHEHPAPDELIETARDMMESAREWVARSGVVPLPDDHLPTVRETLPYARGGFTSMDAPGPFETGSREAFYDITNVLPEWTEEQKQEHLTYFNYPGLLSVTVHETFPGHYVQQGYEREVESDLRRVFTPRSFVEGWAHYVEEMVLDLGFGEHDPALRLGQLRRALQRHARWYAGLHLHAFGAPMDEVVQRFMEIAYFEEFPARREVIRATYDPTYLYYALGRMQIKEIRADYQAYLVEEGEAFNLSQFHDELLRLALPLPLAREAMIPAPNEELDLPSLIRRR